MVQAEDEEIPDEDDEVNDHDLTPQKRAQIEVEKRWNQM